MCRVFWRHHWRHDDWSRSKMRQVSVDDVRWRQSTLSSVLTSDVNLLALGVTPVDRNNGSEAKVTDIKWQMYEHFLWTAMVFSLEAFIETVCSIIVALYIGDSQNSISTRTRLFRSKLISEESSLLITKSWKSIDPRGSSIDNEADNSNASVHLTARRRHWDRQRHTSDDDDSTELRHRSGAFQQRAHIPNYSHAFLIFKFFSPQSKKVSSSCFVGCKRLQQPWSLLDSHQYSTRLHGSDLRTCSRSNQFASHLTSATYALKVLNFWYCNC